MICSYGNIDSEKIDPSFQCIICLKAILPVTKEDIEDGLAPANTLGLRLKMCGCTEKKKSRSLTVLESKRCRR